MDAIACTSISLPVPLLDVHVQPSFQTLIGEDMYKIVYSSLKILFYFFIICKNLGFFASSSFRAQVCADESTSASSSCKICL